MLIKLAVAVTLTVGYMSDNLAITLCGAARHGTARRGAARRVPFAYLSSPADSYSPLIYQTTLTVI